MGRLDLIVLVLGVIAVGAIGAALWVALVAGGVKGTEAAVIVGIASSLLTIAATCVGGLATALNAPSGIASVLDSAKKTPDGTVP